MQFLFHGVKWRYIRSRTKKLGGYCKKNQKLIAVAKDAVGERELDINIHEMLHACSWNFADEEWVAQTATDIAAALWKLGYHKDDPKSEKAPPKRGEQ